MKRFKILLLVVFPLILAACGSYAASQPTQSQKPAAQSSDTTPAAVVKAATDAKLGSILTDQSGKTLYMYTKDEPNVSNCYDQCAQNWPPLIATSANPALGSGLSGQIGVTTRKDGSTQVTYNGEPLYYWSKDVNPGDTSGQGVGSVWFVVHPGATKPAAKAGY